MMQQTATPSTSVLVYLHADQVVRQSSPLTGTHVPGIATRLHVADLGAAIFAAAFWRLREDGLIALEAIKKKTLLVIPSTAVRITVLATAERGGLEGEILAILGAMNGQIDVREVVRVWFGKDVSLPFQAVCGQMNGEAIQLGCMVEGAAQRGRVAGAIKGRTTLDPVPERIAAFDEPARAAIAWWQHAKAAEPLLFQDLLSTCKKAIHSRTKSSDTSDSSDTTSAIESIGSLFD